MRTRIVIGTLLTLLAAGVFYGDQVMGSPYPFLLVAAIILVGFGGVEILGMVPAQRQRLYWFPQAFAGFALAANWVNSEFSLLAVAMALLWFFAMEMREVSAFGESVNRVALAIFIVVYLGVLPGFLVALRLRQPDPLTGTLSLILAVFVPKGCDIGAYFTGSFFGRHPMTPMLSPKKTWEGAAGGIATSIAVAVGVQFCRPIIPGGWIGATACGMVIGAVGLLGDLAESLMKRDGGVKDASQLIPGFGGVLDVIDSIIFAAPFTYMFLHLARSTAAG